MPRRPLPEDLPAERHVEVANRLNSAAIHLLRRISRDDGADGVTGARLSALSVLVYGGPQSLGALARREGVATPTMTRIVDALVRDGLVGRTAVEGDRRQVRLTVTPDGRRLMERGRARRIERLAADLDTLTADQLDALERALDVLEHLEPEASR
ncbi:MAG TPA: MarR family transcriptional regulator [Candidatus Limnocylindrales bacterium]|nr:MarR family transcriptional regulator [Candidatus Limnocylindrales bacterium]